MAKVYNSSQRRSHFLTGLIVSGWLALSYGLLVAAPAWAGPTMFVDINPDHSGPLVQENLGCPNDCGGCPEDCAGGGSGGRVNGLSGVAADKLTYFAASEVGGLFKTTNGGDSWFHLDGHLPTRTWDVAAAPGGLKVYATSFYDGREDSLAGIEVSEDGGLTWRHPTVPPASCTLPRRAQPSAYGISIRPDAPNEVLVGTNCGIQRSTDGGVNWTAGLGVNNVVWDVVALSGGTTYYACGEDGFLSSTDGQNWNKISDPAPNHEYCRLAVSPDEPYVVFAVFATVNFGDYMVARDGKFFESDDGGNSWSQLPCPGKGPTSADCDPYPKRNAFLVTNRRTSGFDLWLGGGNLFAVPCTTPAQPQPGGSPRCTTDTTQWIGTFTDTPDGETYHFWRTHGDSGDLVFDTTVSVDACPTLYSSDGGIYRNWNPISQDWRTSPDCHKPVPDSERATFKPANVGLHSLLLQGMAGVHRPGIEPEDIYMALQDSGFFSTGNAGASKPDWTHVFGGDGNHVVADTARVVLDGGNVWFDAGDMVHKHDGFDDTKCISWGVPDMIDQYGPDQYAIGLYNSEYIDGDGNKQCAGLEKGVQLASDIASQSWSPLGSPNHTYVKDGGTEGICQVRASKGASETDVYALAGSCGYNGAYGAAGLNGDQLWRFANGQWTQVNPPSPGVGFSVFTVDPVNPLRLYASVVIPPSATTRRHAEMYRSTTGGGQWELDERLTDLMYGAVDGNRTFAPIIADVSDGAQAGLCYQPTFVAFDPEDSNILVAGGRESGVFISSDGAASWSLLTDPFTPGISGIPHLPRPFWAHFDHEPPNSLSVYIGTVGRGVWRIDLAHADLSVVKIGMPNSVIRGGDLAYTIQVTNNGPDPALNVTIEDTLPTGLTFKSAQAPPGWSMVTPAIGTGGTVRFTTPSMAVGTATFTVVLHVGSETPLGVLSDTAQVFSAAIDADPTNNAFTASTIVTLPVAPMMSPGVVVGLIGLLTAVGFLVLTSTRRRTR